MAYDQNLSRGLQSAINETPIEDGKLRFAVDTARLFLDLKNERVEFSDFIRGLTRKEIMSLNEPLPKMYMTSDTHELLFYHAGEWISFGGNDGVDARGQVVHTTYLKGLKFVNNDLVGILGNDISKPIEDSIFPELIAKVNELDQKYNELKDDYDSLRADHEALVEAVTKWGEINQLPLLVEDLLGGE